MPINKEQHLPFEVISEDHITDLPPSSGYNSIYVIIDQGCTKRGVFIPCHKTDTAEDIAYLFFLYIYQHFGWPKKRISDRGTMFNSSWIKELCRLTGTEQAMSIAYHPQTDGETERVNQELELFLRTFCGTHQGTWTEWLSLAKFCHNTRPHSTIKTSSFEALMGFTPNGIFLPESPESSNPSVLERIKQIKDNRNSIMEHQKKANEVMSLRQGSNYTLYKVGQKVWLEGKNIKTTMPSVKLNPKRYGPFEIIEQINPVAFKLQLPNSMKIRPVFYASLLYPYTETEIHRPNFTRPPPDTVDDTEEWKVEAIVGKRSHYGKK